MTEKTLKPKHPITVDPSLDKLEGKDLFPEQTKRAREVLARLKKSEKAHTASEGHKKAA